MRYFVASALVILISSCKSGPTGASLTKAEPGLAGNTCGNYFPGTLMNWQSYQSLSDKIRTPYPDYKYSYPNYLEFLAAAELEFLCGIDLVFREPTKANVFYGSYNEGIGAKDGGRGFRVIWSRPVVVNNDPRLINVITFWNYDKGSNSFQLNNSNDALRIRIQLVPDAAGKYGRPNYGGLSFGLEVERGKVSRIYTKPIVDKAGKVLPGLPQEATPDGCAGCHAGSQISHHLNPPPTLTPFKGDYRLPLNIDYAKYTSKHIWHLKELFSANPSLAKNENFFTNPKKNFYPIGLTEAIAKRIGELKR